MEQDLQDLQDGAGFARLAGWSRICKIFKQEQDLQDLQDGQDYAGFAG